MSTIQDYERQFLLSQLGVSGVGQTIDDLRLEFYKGVVEGTISAGGETDEVFLSRSSSLIVPNGVDTVVPWTQDDLVTLAAYRPGGFPETVRVPAGTTHDVTAIIRFNANATGVREVALMRNSTTELRRVSVPAKATGLTYVAMTLTLKETFETDFSVMVKQTSGADLVMSQFSTFLFVRLR